MRHDFKKTVLASVLAAGVLTFPFVCSASTITVKNESDSEVTAHIEPGEGKIVTTSNSPQVKYTLKAGEKKVIEVKKDSLGDVEVFSVKGSVTAPSLYNRCTGLFMSKDYTVAFVPGKVGVICYAN